MSITFSRRCSVMLWFLIVIALQQDDIVKSAKVDKTEEI